MSHPGDSDLDDDGAEIRTALAALVESEPDLPSGSADIERRGRRRLVARRLGGGIAVAVVLAAGLTAGLIAVSLAPREAAGPTPAAQSPGVPASARPVDTDLVLAAVARALPDGFSIDDAPIIDAIGGQGLEVEIQLARQDDGERNWLLTVGVAESGCTATVEPTGAFSDAELDAIADVYCAAREDHE